MHVCMYAFVYVWTYVSTISYMYLCMYDFREYIPLMHTCMYVCMHWKWWYMFMHMHIHVFVCPHTPESCFLSNSAPGRSYRETGFRALPGATVPGSYRTFYSSSMWFVMPKLWIVGLITRTHITCTHTLVVAIVLFLWPRCALLGWLLCYYYYYSLQQHESGFSLFFVSKEPLAVSSTLVVNICIYSCTCTDTEASCALFCLLHMHTHTNAYIHTYGSASSLPLSLNTWWVTGHGHGHTMIY
jgi:hypothetical protein